MLPLSLLPPASEVEYAGQVQHMIAGISVIAIR